MLIDIMFALGMLFAVSTISYIVGTKWNWNAAILKLKNKELQEWQHQYNVMRGRYADAIKKWENPDIKIPEGSTVAQSIQALIEVLPPKWRKVAREFEPVIMHELQTNPEAEGKIKDAVMKIANTQPSGKREEERIAI